MASRTPSRFAHAIALAVIIGCKGAEREQVIEGPCNGGIVLPAGFCATIFADSLGSIRHLAVASNGDLYVARWGGKGHGGGFLALRDTTSDDQADVIDSVTNSGGSGITIWDV